MSVGVAGKSRSPFATTAVVINGGSDGDQNQGDADVPFQLLLQGDLSKVEIATIR